MAALALLTAVVALAVLYQVLKQQGRMLLRIDALERHLGGLGGHGGQAVPVGPPSGSVLEPFSLPDLDGHEVSSESFRGRRVLLVNWSAACGFCDLIGPDLAGALPELRRSGTEVLLLAHGDADANRASVDRYGLDAPVLLVGNATHVSGFEGVGTPAALLVDAEGKVASGRAVGADRVLELVEELASPSPPAKGLRGQKPLSESRLVRDGLKPGTPAPVFSMPDVWGRPFSLADLRGKRVLVAFTDPDCGPCQELTPELARLHGEHRDNNLAVVLVCRGDAEANRRKAREEGLEFPVVVQDGWKLSKEYGIFATPVGFLIDEQGVIAKEVAKGVDDIVALVGEER